VAVNGFRPKAAFKNSALDTVAAIWLEARAVALYPKSDFANRRGALIGITHTSRL
jgi:hypothetical protein